MPSLRFGSWPVSVWRGPGWSGVSTKPNHTGSVGNRNNWKERSSAFSSNSYIITRYPTFFPPFLKFSFFSISDQEIFREADCDLCVDGGNTFCNFPSLRLEQIRVRGINFLLLFIILSRLKVGYISKISFLNIGPFSVKNCLICSRCGYTTGHHHIVSEHPISFSIFSFIYLLLQNIK